MVFSTLRVVATQRPSVFPERKSQISTTPSDSAPSLRTLFSTQLPDMLIMMTPPSQKTPDVLILSNTSPTLRSLVCLRITQATLFFSPVMLVVSYHLFQSSIRHKLCSTSFLVTLQRWLVQKMVSPSPKLPSHLASLNHSWHYIL